MGAEPRRVYLTTSFSIHMLDRRNNKAIIEIERIPVEELVREARRYKGKILCRPSKALFPSMVNFVTRNGLFDALPCVKASVYAEPGDMFLVLAYPRVEDEDTIVEPRGAYRIIVREA